METRHTRAYWPTRIMLAFAILSLPAVSYWLVAMQPGTMGPPHEPLSGVGWAILAVASGLWLAGVIWMMRIFRGPSDKPAKWRYRDR